MSSQVAALRRCCRVQGPKMLFFGEEKKDFDENSFPKVATFFPAVNRIVAVGDVHGDVNALKGCMKIANLIDDDCNWIGGDTHFVQVCN